MELTEQDFELMLTDIIQRRSTHTEWLSNNGQYVQGITKYISDKLWLTPINQSILHQPNQPIDQNGLDWAQDVGQPYIPDQSQKRLIDHE